MDLGSSLQTWEPMVGRYNKKNAKVGEVKLAEDIKRSALESMALEYLERHLPLNVRRLKKFDDVRVEMYAYFESCTGNDREVASKEGVKCDDPMDVDSLVEGKFKTIAL